MKNTLLSLTALVVLFFSIAGCSKSSNPPHTYTNVTLWNKPIDTIKHYLYGKWQLIYTEGGYTALRNYKNNTFWTFKDTNRIIQEEQNKIVLDTDFDWKWDYAYFTGGDSSFQICYPTNSTSPRQFVVYSIINDTLVLNLGSPERVSFNFIKQ